MGSDKAELATDDNMKTRCHTECAFDSTVWYKMRFDANYCFSEIMIVQSYHDESGYRMNGTKIAIVNTYTGEESLCGILSVKDQWSVKGQTYKIPCQLKCGNEVKLTVHRKSGSAEACIHMEEILAFYSSGMLRV